jgi:hypothetical protein
VDVKWHAEIADVSARYLGNSLTTIPTSSGSPRRAI